MQLSMLAPVQATSGRVFGRKGAACTRTINGKTYSYSWPENYNYPVIFNRAKQNLLLRMAQQAYFWRMLRLNGNPNVYLYELQGYDHGAMATPAHHILKQHIK